MHKVALRGHGRELQHRWFKNHLTHLNEVDNIGTDVCADNAAATTTNMTNNQSQRTTGILLGVPIMSRAIVELMQ